MTLWEPQLTGRDSVPTIQAAASSWLSPLLVCRPQQPSHHMRARLGLLSSLLNEVAECGRSLLCSLPFSLTDVTHRIQIPLTCRQHTGVKCLTLCISPNAGCKGLRQLGPPRLGVRNSSSSVCCSCGCRRAPSPHCLQMHDGPCRLVLAFHVVTATKPHGKHLSFDSAWLLLDMAAKLTPGPRCCQQ